jgi:hypothetical protein
MQNGPYLNGHFGEVFIDDHRGGGFGHKTDFSFGYPDLAARRFIRHGSAGGHQNLARDLVTAFP